MKIYDQIKTGSAGIANALASLLVIMKSGKTGQDFAAALKPVAEAYAALDAGHWVLPEGDSELAALHSQALKETKEVFDFYKKLLLKSEKQKSGASGDRMLLESLGRAISAWNKFKTTSEARASYYAKVG